MVRQNYKNLELKKLILKNLIFDQNFEKNSKIYFFKIFSKLTKFGSISFMRHSCYIHGYSKSVSRYFKMARHQCRFFATNGLIAGLRKASF